MTQTIEDFGTALLDTEDLDPVYLALSRVDWPPATLRRWLLGYWAFYHAGTASWLAEAPDAAGFWARATTAARNDELSPCGSRWPRGAERRHMRGTAAVRCVESLRKRYPDHPEVMADYCAGFAGPTTCSQVMSRVKIHYLFGEWIGFKVADMLERVLRVPVSFAESEVLMFDAPRDAAVLLWNMRGRPATLDIVGSTARSLVEYFAGRLAPPHYDRPIGLQEVETILCKWKSHVGGHYEVRKDIDEIRHGLAPWTTHCILARQFLEGMPR
jgi:hypothetical protein